MKGCVKTKLKTSGIINHVEVSTVVILFYFITLEVNCEPDCYILINEFILLFITVFNL